MPVEVIRTDADDDVRHAVDRHGLPDDVGIGSRPSLPEAMAQDNARLGRRRVVRR
jgi:hypothetical protein